MSLFTKSAANTGERLTQAATEAHDRVDSVHLCTFAGPSKMSGLDESDVSQILSAIADLGWTPVNCSFVLAGNVGAVGHYLFVRSDKEASQ